MAQRLLLPIAVVAVLGGCASLGEPVLDADGCRPAMALYQPGVGPGAAGMVIQVPRSCPARVAVTPEMMVALAAMQGAQDAAREQAAAGQAPERPPPPAPVGPEAAIHNGLEDFCGWFFGDQPYSLEGLRQAAFDAGYGGGAPVQIIPLPEMLREMSFSSVGFTAVADAAPSHAHGVAAFVSFHNPVCQIQVHGYTAEADAALARLEAGGWRKIGGSARGALWEAQRYHTVDAARPMTLVDNRLTHIEGASLRRVINVVPGHDPVRGLLE